MVGWCEAHPGSYPPTILHVTDGQSTDGAPEEVADELRQISTKDGQALLFNLHVTTGGGPEMVFPHLFQLQLQSYPLTLYHLDGAALARCTALIAHCGSAATDIERMAAHLLAAVSQPKVAECAKGRFFDRASEKLGQLARFDTNELVSVDLRAMAAALPSHRGEVW